MRPRSGGHRKTRQGATTFIEPQDGRGDADADVDDTSGLLGVQDGRDAGSRDRGPYHTQGLQGKTWKEAHFILNQHQLNLDKLFVSNPHLFQGGHHHHRDLDANSDGDRGQDILKVDNPNANAGCGHRHNDTEE